MGKQAPALFEQLEKALEGGEGEELVKKIKVSWCREYLLECFVATGKQFCLSSLGGRTIRVRRHARKFASVVSRQLLGE